MGNVALLAEGVDRNWPARLAECWIIWSPSSRRAWIEIADAVHWEHKEGCRPPRGGRG